MGKQSRTYQLAMYEDVPDRQSSVSTTDYCIHRNHQNKVALMWIDHDDRAMIGLVKVVRGRLCRECSEQIVDNWICLLIHLQ